jgi:guanylate kinase
MNARKSLLVIVSGPSGCGKTTLCQNLRAVEPFYYTVSCTTRPQRPGEVHGEHYFFLSDAEFAHLVETDAMLEHATVHGRDYGTLKAEVLPRLRAGTDVIMDLDPQGAAQIRACADPEIQAARVDVFILPTTAETFRKRLAARDSESAEQVELRMNNAREEMKHWREYDYALISGTREQDLAALRTILAAERMKADRLITADADGF